jgi:glycosyltransferase involved in cell wall biosynthesis
MIAALDRRRVAMDVCCKGGQVGHLVESATRHDARVFHVPLRPTHLGFLRNFRRLLQRSPYDLVHNHLDVASAPITWACQRVKVPMISSFHNTTFPPHTWTRWPVIRQLRSCYGKHSVRYSLDRAVQITGCSQAVLDQVCRGPADIARARVLYYGVDVNGPADQATREAVRHELGLAAQTPLVLHVGRFAAQKNHSGLLRVFHTVASRLPAARLLLVGAGPLQREVEQRVRHLGLERQVKFLGLRRDVERLMSASDVFLFPSHHEGFGLVTIEACAAGLPVVGSDIPGHDETVVHGQSGFLYPVADEGAMAERVLHLLTCPELAQRVQQQALRRARQIFSLSTAAANLQQLYHDALQQPAAGQRFAA